MQADGAPPVGCRSAGGSFERAMPSDYSGDEESNYEPSPTPGDRAHDGGRRRLRQRGQADEHHRAWDRPGAAEGLLRGDGNSDGIHISEEDHLEPEHGEQRRNAMRRVEDSRLDDLGLHRVRHGQLGIDRIDQRGLRSGQILRV